MQLTLEATIRNHRKGTLHSLSDKLKKKERSEKYTMLKEHQDKFFLPARLLLYISHTKGKKERERLVVLRERRRKRPELNWNGKRWWRTWLGCMIFIRNLSDKISRRSLKDDKHGSLHDFPQMMRWKRFCSRSNLLLLHAEDPIKRGAQYSKSERTKEL